jgi:3-hydroxyisobutyrate dehydrogenase-like beta-hydroxyacid dehydrogenase
MTVLVMNPGQMGIAVAHSLQDAGHDVIWVSAGRGEASWVRADDAGLRAVQTLVDATTQASHVVSVVPPASAVDAAQQVAATGFSGVYIDANAVSPATGATVCAAVTAGGASYVDGGIIGPPPKTRGSTRLYLAGPRAVEAAALFADSRMDARVVDENNGSTAASALKMAYAGWTKASSALLLTARALARCEGVEAALLDEWAISLPHLVAASDKAATANAFKAWRFVAEMHEIADTMQSNELPDGFHRGAADLWSRLAEFKDLEDTTPQSVFEKLAGSANNKP